MTLPLCRPFRPDSLSATGGFCAMLLQRLVNNSPPAWRKPARGQWRAAACAHRDRESKLGVLEQVVECAWARVPLVVSASLFASQHTAGGPPTRQHSSFPARSSSYAGTRGHLHPHPPATRRHRRWHAAVVVDIPRDQSPPPPPMQRRSAALRWRDFLV